MNEKSLASDVLKIMSTRPTGLISDIDGTLSRISDHPAQAVLDPQIEKSLNILVRHFDVMAVVTGRAAVEAGRLVDIDGVLHLGNHGMERLECGELVASNAALPYVQPLKRVMNEARKMIADPLVLFENKGVSGSIHYRNATDPALAHKQILAILAPLAKREGLRLTQGRMVIEIRPPIEINKGTALIDVVRECGLRSVVFMGDDVTDVDAMRALSRMRDEGAVTGLSIGVVGLETPEEVIEGSDRLVKGIDGVSSLLANLVKLLNTEPA